MASSGRKIPAAGSGRGEIPGDGRRSHSIRFADSEWSLIERAAARQSVPAGEFALTGALAAAEHRIGEPPPATLSTGHASLVETMRRMVYVLATRSRDEMLDAGREEDLDELVAETMEEGSG